jgi:hypothetical protein
MTAVSIQIEGAPWNSAGTGPGTFAIISSTYIAQGTNPLTSATSSTLILSDGWYQPFVRTNVTVFTPTGTAGTVTARIYGYKGTSAAGSPPAGTVTAVTASTPLASSGGTTPNISISVEQGTGPKVQLAAGTATPGDCIKYDANGNAIDAAAPCGTGIGTVTAVTGVAPISSSGGATPAISVANMTGDSGAGGAAGTVPAPGAGTSAAGDYLNAGGTWTKPAGSGLTCSTPSYVMVTIYQNTQATPKFITVTAYSAITLLPLQVLIGSTSPPTTQIADVGIVGNLGLATYWPVTFIVPPGWYFRLSSSGATSGWALSGGQEECY